MTYTNLKKAFHNPNIDEDALLKERLSSTDATVLPFKIGSAQAFHVNVTDVYRLILQAERLDKEIAMIRSCLPSKAIEHYMTNCLIDEIVLTNEIEGVYSTRKEIGEVLDKLKNNDKYGRFHGIVSKYMMLTKREEIAISTCSDIRSIYDELVLSEIVAESPDNMPNGKYFRAGSVSVCDASQREIHHGVEPESKIIELMEHGLAILGNDKYELLVRVSIFHFLFGYVHPFYDGNGRTNRFISSYTLAQGYDPLVAFRLSYSIKKKIRQYYKGFLTCEHVLNKGDLTPFIIMFSEIVVDAMQSMLDSLMKRKRSLDECLNMISSIPEVRSDTKLEDFAEALIQAALFSEAGITAKELCTTFSLSKPTVYKKLKTFKECGLLLETQIGHQVYYEMDIKELNKFTANNL